MSIQSEAMEQDVAAFAPHRMAPGGVQKRGLPEYSHYEDTGCEAAPSCLECPLAMCKYDDPGWDKRLAKAKRDAEIMKQRQAGIGIDRIAASTGVSRRTVYRILSRTAEKTGSNIANQSHEENPMTLEELSQWSPVVVYQKELMPSLSRVEIGDEASQHSISGSLDQRRIRTEVS